MADTKFTYGLIIFSLAMTLLLPIGLSIFAHTGSTNAELNTQEQLDGYYNFTGTSPSREAIWSLTGIYTPYGVNDQGEAELGRYGYSDDGWLYGSSIPVYEPSQYLSRCECQSENGNDDQQYHHLLRHYS